MMLSKEQIVGNKIPITRLIHIKQVSAVYFLIDDLSVVYVGQTKNLKNRISSHKCLKQKKFDGYYFIELDNYEDRLILEKKYIEFLDTPLNLPILGNTKKGYKIVKNENPTLIEKKIVEKFKNINRARKEFGVSQSVLTYWCRKDPKQLNLSAINKIANHLQLNANDLLKEIINN